jgi:hypothetical protein
MADEATPERRKRGPGRPFLPGQTGNAGGVPKWRRELEAMLDAEHRTPAQLRETFALIRRVAHGVEEPVYYKGEIVGHVVKYDGAWMELYLNRVLGPVKDIKIDLTEAPEEVVQWIAENLN